MTMIQCRCGQVEVALEGEPNGIGEPKPAFSEFPRRVGRYRVPDVGNRRVIIELAGHASLVFPRESMTQASRFRPRGI